MKQVILLAGGKGTRLSTLNKETPKPMVKIMGKPLIQYQVELCKKFGFDDIHILIHYKGNKIREYLGDGRKFDLNITYHEENIPRGTAGAVLDILDKLSDVFLIIYGDTFLNVNLEQFYTSHLTKKSAWARPNRACRHHMLPATPFHPRCDPEIECGSLRRPLEFCGVISVRVC